MFTIIVLALLVLWSGVFGGKSPLPVEVSNIQTVVTNAQQLKQAQGDITLPAVPL
jgi:hypothetical protein